MSLAKTKVPERSDSRLPASAARREKRKPESTTPRLASRLPIWLAPEPAGIRTETWPVPAPLPGWKTANSA